MKTTILVLLAFFFILQNARCQNSYGLKGGINLAHQKYAVDASPSFPAKTYQTKSIFGYRFGGFFKTKIVGRLWFSTAVNFSSIGAKQQYLVQMNNDLVEQYFNERVGYLEVPLWIQYNLKRFYVSAGPSVSFKLYAQTSLPSGELRYNTIDVAGAFSGGYRISKRWDI
ncbi:MAG: outer membrane beta-barrel protein, partial [Chitinophagaceae bacterium]